MLLCEGLSSPFEKEKNEGKRKRRKRKRMRKRRRRKERNEKGERKRETSKDVFLSFLFFSQGGSKNRAPIRRNRAPEEMGVFVNADTF